MQESPWHLINNLFSRKLLKNELKKILSNISIEMESRQNLKFLIKFLHSFL